MWEIDIVMVSAENETQLSDLLGVSVDSVHRSSFHFSHSCLWVLGMCSDGLKLLMLG